MIANFIKTHGDRRIRQETIEHYEGLKSPSIGFYAFHNDELVGLSCCSEDSSYSITVVHSNFRNKGIGAALQHLKISALDVPFQSWVASDNPASLRIAEKNGLKPIKEVIKTRTSGEYIARLFSNV